mgnify:CR=1 FL=1
MAEASNDRLARLLVLVPWLTAHSGVSKLEAAEHFGITVSQLESDLSLITFTGPGVYGGELVDIYFDDDTVTVYDSQGLTQPLQLTADEVSALLIGLQALQQLPDVDTALVASVIEKLSPAASDSDFLNVELQTTAHSPLIAQAIASTVDLNIEYCHSVRDDTTRRRVTPLAVVARDGVDYLSAWCHSAEAMRTFRLERIVTCELGAPSAPREVPPTESVPSQTATVRASSSHRYLLEGVHATVLSEGSEITARVPYVDAQWLIHWVVASAGRIHIVEPRHLVESARSAAKSGRNAYAAIEREG